MSEVSPLQDLKTKIADLKLAIDKNVPGLSNILAIIHMNLLKQEDLVYMLSEEEIAVIVTGLSKQTGIVLAATESKAAKGAKLKNMTELDL